MEELLKLFGLQKNSLIVIIGAICLAIIALSNFIEAAQKLSNFLTKVVKKQPTNNLSDKKNTFNPKKRKFLKICISLVIAAAGGFLIASILRVKITFDFAFDTFKAKPNNRNSYLIANRKTGTIHHSKICSQHLPENKNQTFKFAKIKNPHAHQFRNLNIFEEMASQFENENRIEEAIIFFKKAIEFSPERVHLYDKLVKIYGKQKNIT